MKYGFIICALLVAGISADVLQPVVKNVKIESYIEHISGQLAANFAQTIINKNLDPFVINEITRRWSVPGYFNATAFGQNILLRGLSDIQVLHAQFNSATNTLEFQFEIPHVHASTAYCYTEFLHSGRKDIGILEGSIDIYGVVLEGCVRVVIGGDKIIVHQTEIYLIVENILSRITELVVAKYDLTNRANEIIGEKIPKWLAEYNVYISACLEIYLTPIIEKALNNKF